MKISDAIQKLEVLQSSFGDIELAQMSEELNECFPVMELHVIYSQQYLDKLGLETKMSLPIILVE